MVTIHDVARVAGVPVATVSRYLAGESVHSGAQIRETIESLGYQPESMADTPRWEPRNLVAVIVPDISNPYFATVVCGIEESCSAHGLRILVASSSERTDQELQLIKSLQPAVDAFVVVPVADDGRVTSALLASGLPVVLVDRTLKDAHLFDQVWVDNARGARTAAKHLLELGHERVGVISGPGTALPGRVRHESFVQTFADAGIELPPEYLQVGTFTLAHGRNAIRRLLALAKPPTAVFTGNNLISFGVLLEIKNQGVKVPEELSVIGFDDLDLAELLSPPLTVVTRDAIGEGRAAGDMLHRRLQGPNLRVLSAVHPIQFLLRDSTASPRLETSLRMGSGAIDGGHWA